MVWGMWLVTLTKIIYISGGAVSFFSFHTKKWNPPLSDKGLSKYYYFVLCQSNESYFIKIAIGNNDNAGLFVQKSITDNAFN